ncbi:nucleotide-diphospho-sugar transferase [Chryseolinea sp. H1M3-3]|uniref:nucleotide-diphospho-sugar transferase n=1 Tax=Chryseolinea sp. H1M3-3 TaxID=3034144 RepID=UPI0023EB7B01|nr:nucleotide-diphospho-sugar transferase [Chryseolinea sp. H1M3-3]
MKQSTSDVPVLFMIFNRAETTRKVFDAIRQEKPKRLFVAADGPRANKPGEAEKCEEVRKIATAVDWDCEVKTLFRSENLGCGRAPAGAITWFFEHVEEGIILEDDCLPSHDFFLYCAELLERYRNDNRIMEIGGNNFLDTAHKQLDYSYYFSNHNMIWGWATWRRAWKIYDFEMKLYNKVRDSEYLKSCFRSDYELDYFKWIFDKTVGAIQNVTWWDYQWEFIRRINSGLTIIPQKNLVVNLGLGTDATHTLDPNGAGHNLKLEPLSFPLKHPEFVVPDVKKDDSFFRNTFTTGLSRIKWSLKKVIPNFILDLRSKLIHANAG